MAHEQTIVEAAELVELAPGLDEREAARLLTFAARAVRGHLYPNEVPDPTPEPVKLVLLAHALRIGRAAVRNAGEVVSESIGTYTYRLARSLPLDAALRLDDDLAAELEPWAPEGRRKVYDVSTAGRPLAQLLAGEAAGFANAGRLWPANAFERNLDNLDDLDVVPSTEG